MDLHSLLTNLWSIFLIALFLGGSIFVHELGHFLAARRRGVKVERFSIGFGPKIFSWRGKDGVEYRLSWLPLGGYVALPQLADMREIEGGSATDVDPLPPPSYSTKVIVFAAGAVFNIIFAFLIASVLWYIGQRVVEEEQTNRIGVVLPTIELPSGKTVPGPAFVAGVKPGDRLRAVDGKSVASLSDIDMLVALGSGRGPEGEPKVDLTLEREGKLLQVSVFPQYVGSEKIRNIGLESTLRIMAAEVLKDGAAAAAGLKPGDVITHIDGQPVAYVSFISGYLRETTGRPVKVTFLRDEKSTTVSMTPKPVVDPETKITAYRIGVALRGALNTKIVHIPPWTQLGKHAVSMWRTLVSLISPKSDIGLSKMTGPIGIADSIHTLAKFDFTLVLWFTALINVNLAIFNLLPIPVLDGGHILFATIGKLRGRALPATFIAATQSVFIVLLLSMALYVSVFDVRRIYDRKAVQVDPKPAPVEPAPAKP